MSVEIEYRALVDAMTVVERVQRAEALNRWARDYLARSILAEHAPITEARLKREIALRLYGGDPVARQLIEELPIRLSVEGPAGATKLAQLVKVEGRALITLARA